VQFYRRIKSILEAIANVPPPPPGIIQQVKDTKITFDDVLALIKKHEGQKNSVYTDTVGKRTIGVGFNLERKDAPSIIKQIGADYNKVLSGEQSLTDNQIKELFQINIRTAYADAKKYLPQFEIAPSLGGSGAWIKGPDGFNAQSLANNCATRGVLIEPGDIFFNKSSTKSHSHFRLGYSAIQGSLIDAGVQELSGAYKDIRS
jgi:hypothetical protein